MKDDGFAEVPRNYGEQKGGDVTPTSTSFLTFNNPVQPKENKAKYIRVKIDLLYRILRGASTSVSLIMLLTYVKKKEKKSKYGKHEHDERAL